MFDENTVCPLCGGEMEAWHGSIKECSECGNMIDVDVLEESGDGPDEIH